MYVVRIKQLLVCLIVGFTLSAWFIPSPSNAKSLNELAPKALQLAFNNTLSKTATSQKKPFAISNLRATKITHNSAVINWDLTENGTGQVQFGTSKNFGQRSRKEISYRFDKHIQTIKGLKPDTTYYYRAQSRSRNYKGVSSRTKQFKTTSVPASGSTQTTLPAGSSAAKNKKVVISGLEVTSIKHNSAVVKWKLNQKGTGYVDFGITHNLGQNSRHEKSYKFDKHVQPISGLKPNTRYYYRVISAGLDKNEVQSSKKSFKTPALAMKISNVSAKVNGNNVEFSWDLNQHGTGVVEFGPSKKFGRNTTPANNFKWDSHRQKASKLKPNTVFYYRVKSAPRDGAVSVSDIYSFKTGGAVSDDVANNVDNSSSTITSNPVTSGTINTVSTSHNWPKNADEDLPMGGVFYGNYMSGVGLQNAGIGIESTRRFRAERSGTLHHVKYNNRTLNNANIKDRCKSNGPDSDWCKCVDNGLDKYTCGYTLGSAYSVGNGGKIVVELRTNTSKGLPSNEVLGKTEPFVPMDSKESFPTLKFTNKPRVQAGQIYHLVFTNLNPPTTCTQLARVKPSEASKCPKNQGAQGLNGPRMFTKPSKTGSFGPYLGDEASAVYYKRTKNHSWKYYPTSLAWYALGYSDGVSVGDSYTPYYVLRDAKHIIGGSTKARQNFNVLDATRHVNGMWLKFGHLTTSDRSPINVVLKDSNGNALTTGSIKASELCLRAVKVAKNGFELNCQDWGYTSFKTAVKLQKGSRYSVELSSGAKGGYVLLGYYTYRPYHGLRNRNEWLESRVELSKNNGSSWGAWSPTHANDRDLPLLFTIVGMPKQFR